MSSRRRIAVIGAGPNGLAALKVFRDHGHEMVLFEKESSIGGLWNYRDEGRVYAPHPDRSQRINSCYASLAMNTSKRMSQFSDLPASDSLSAFMSHSEFLQYVQEYTRHFHLEELIKFSCNVTKLCPAADTPSAHQWEVHYLKKGVTEMEVFDKIVIASGPFPNVLLPEYPGMNEFQGVMIHSAQVRQDNLFEDKRVLLVGGSFSAAEMVGVALKAKVKALYWSISDSPQEKNRWMFDRFPTGSRCWDENVTRHDYFMNPQVFGGKFVSWLDAISQCEEGEAVLKSPPDRLTITNTGHVQRGLLGGRVRKVAPIKRFTEHSVLLADDTTVDKVDVVVFCTGFTSRFHFLDGLWDLKHQTEAVLYRHMLPAETQLQGLAFVGLPYTLTALFPTAEMQSRWLVTSWASRSYDHDGALYTSQEMEDFQAGIQKRVDSLVPSEPYNFIADSYGYVEALAKEFGCQPPDPSELLSKDRELALALLHGPLIAAQYRIAGPHPWAGARECLVKTAQEVLGQKWQDLLAAE